MGYTRDLEGGGGQFDGTPHRSDCTDGPGVSNLIPKVPTYSGSPLLKALLQDHDEPGVLALG